MRYTILIWMFLLIIVKSVIAEEFSHCNAILEHGISDITRHKSTDHSRAFKWHSNCGSELNKSSDTTITSAHASIFGYGSGGGSYNRSQYLSKIKTWCTQNRDFALENHDLFEEAQVINKPSLLAWNQCQEIAKKGVEITFTPQGAYSQTVHFSIDSTLDSDLTYFGTSSTNYKCKEFIKGKNDGLSIKASEQPLIKNSNIHIECIRNKPSVKEIDGVVGKIKYEFASISVNTSGPALPVSFHEIISEYRVTPPGAVLAFNSETCPPGWRDYKPAYGRFIRGIDRSNSGIDPDGSRTPGATQSDAYESHSHTRPRDVYDAGGGADASWVAHSKHFGYGHKNAPRTGTEGTSSETRPKNIALLYCEKG